MILKQMRNVFKRNFEPMIAAKLKNYFLFYSALLISQCVIAQNEFNNWHFGIGATLNFNAGSPTAGNNSSLSTFEGSAAVSDCQGNLLFYTDGVTVWNKNNSIMSNGSGLDGGSSSSLGTSSAQGALIVKRPETSGIYYIFTSSASKGFKYSVVNITLNGGLGQVIVKNIILSSEKTEKIAVTYHRNDKDIWVVTHYGDNTNKYESFLVTGNGLVPSSITSLDGSHHDDSHGDLKISRDGSKIAAVVDFAGTVYLADFNNSTGTVTNTASLSGFSNPHGVEFSPDNSKMYVNSTVKGILQFSVSGTNSQTLSNSISIGTSSNIYGSLQLGPDDKIYVANDQSSYIGAINNPNAIGNAADFSENSVFIDSSRSSWGIVNVTLTTKNSNNKPNVVQFTGTCENYITKFSLANISNIVDVVWEFGDTSAVLENYSIEISPEHQYPGAGSYDGQVTINYNCGSETINFSVVISEVTIDNENSCSLDSSLSADIKEPPSSFFKVFPNPTTSRLNYSFKHTIGIGSDQTISLTDILGNQVHTKRLLNVSGDTFGSIPCESLDRGVYFLSLKNKTEQITLKVILQ